MTNIGTLTHRSWTQAVAQCPKHMEHGPCAGVSAAGWCEVGPRCAFLDVADTLWPYLDERGEHRLSPRTEAASEFLDLAATRAVVVVDVVAPPLSAGGLRRVAAELAPFADACLIGDHGAARVQFPPSYRVRLLADEGARAWAGINCRDRNRVAIEGEIAACVDAGALGVHCVTGDHPASGHRADAQPVFDLDCIDVVERVVPTGALCSVAHAPAAPPVGSRLARLLAKVEAGADVVFLDHCGGVQPVAAAVGALRAAGFAGLVFTCVPVVTSALTAKVLRSFAGDRLPAGYLESIAGAPDAEIAGIDAALELALSMLAVAGVDGVNLSAGAPAGYELAAASGVAEVARRLAEARGGLPS